MKTKSNLWSPEEIQRLRDEYRQRIPIDEIAARHGRSRSAVAVKAYRLRLRMGIPTKIRLTAAQKLWLRANFPNMRSQLCASYLGISLRSCIRIARGMGLEKTPQFMKECQAFSLRRARESHTRNHTWPPKGVVNANLAKGAAYRFKPRAGKASPSPRSSSPN